MSARIKFQENDLRSPRLRDRSVVPYVLIMVPFAAYRYNLSGFFWDLHGYTDTSAPVSTKNCTLEVVSDTKSRPLLHPSKLLVNIDFDGQFSFLRH